MFRWTKKAFFQGLIVLIPLVLLWITLRELVELARGTASATNRQPLKYFLSADPETNERIFPCLFWAAFSCFSNPPSMPVRILMIASGICPTGIWKTYFCCAPLRRRS